jgi:hypothetical protein
MAYDLYPAVDENYDFPPEVRQSLAVSLELRNTVVPMTSAVRNNLGPTELWDGRLIANTTTDHMERYDAGSGYWVVIAELSDIDGKVSRSGDSMAGPLVVQQPTAFDQAARLTDGIPRFTTPSARDAGIAAPVPGMHCYITSLNQQQVYMSQSSGGPAFAWVPSGGVMPMAKATFAPTGLGAGVGRIAIPPSSVLLDGGMTSHVADPSLLVLPVRGMYRFTALAGFTSVPVGAICWVSAGTDVGHFGLGTHGRPTDSGEYGSIRVAMQALVAGTKIALWYSMPVSGSMGNGAILHIDYISPLS